MLQRSAPFEFWQSVTGSLDTGESSSDAARRELLEETGLTTEGTLIHGYQSRMFTIDARWRDRYAPGVSENTEHEWRYRLSEVADIKIDVSEHSKFRWVSIDVAIDSVWSWTNKEALIALKTELRQNPQ